MITCVAGGATTIGSELCKVLLSKGHDVYCLDDFRKSELVNLIDCFEKKEFIFFDYKIEEDEDIKLAGKIDYIFNVTDYGSKALNRICNNCGCKYIHTPPEHIARMLLTRAGI